MHHKTYGIRRVILSLCTFLHVLVTLVEWQVALVKSNLVYHHVKVEVNRRFGKLIYCLLMPCKGNKL